MIMGYNGKILKVNLTDGRIKSERIEESFYRKWLGGYGLAARIIYDELVPKCDPLGPLNIVAFTTGPLTGLTPFFAGSFYVSGKSPLTGAWADSRCGGDFGPKLKHAGYDAVFVYGRSEKPVYLKIDDDAVEIKSANDVWGEDTYAADEILKKESKDKSVSVVSIGPSGEKLSKIACIMNDKWRAAGRGGLGAVMGSKRLKAIVVRGTGKTSIADEKGLTDLTKDWLKIMKENSWLQHFSKVGTDGDLVPSAYSGDAPVKNWGGSTDPDFKSVEKISADSLNAYGVKKYGCYGCSVACGLIVKVEKGPFTVGETHKPEYETLAMFGTNCLNDNLESIICANDICNKYGLDTISTAAAIAFSIECYENGIISKQETDGLEMTWGNAEAIVKMTEKLAKREGFGDILADGTRIAAQKIGKGAEKFAMHVGGVELPAHDPKKTPGLGTTYIAEASIGRHPQGTEWGETQNYLGGLITGIKIPDIKEKYDPHSSERAFAHTVQMKYKHVINALGGCMFAIELGYQGAPRSFDFHRFVNAATGWNVNMKDLLVCGERIACIRQAFNVREGFKPADFRLPDRIVGKPPLKHGALKDVTIYPEIQVREYFKFVDWDYETGKPSEEKLRELGLEDLAKDLY